jgi:hypothetical protein
VSRRLYGPRRRRPSADTRTRCSVKSGSRTQGKSSGGEVEEALLAVTGVDAVALG